MRPEAGLLGLRRELDVYANLRPAVQGEVDLLVVRELVGGLYFGARGVRDDGTVFDTCEYHPDQIVRVARRAFELRAHAPPLGRLRRQGERARHLAPLAPGGRARWRPTTPTSSSGTRSSTAPRWTSSAIPSGSTSLLTENMFGDILSDVAAAVTGGLGLAASASLGDDGPGIFEPVHGSAPDIAGTGSANPAAMLRSLALLLRYALDRTDLAEAVSESVDAALGSHPTPDLGGTATTSEFESAVVARLEEAWSTTPS